MQERWGQRRSRAAAVKQGGENTWTMSVGSPPRRHIFDVMIALCEKGAERYRPCRPKNGSTRRAYLWDWIPLSRSGCSLVGVCYLNMIEFETEKRMHATLLDATLLSKVDYW
jgi:hypothetical protein